MLFLVNALQRRVMTTFGISRPDASICNPGRWSYYRKSFTNLWASAAVLFAQLLKSTLLKQTQRDSAEIVVREFLLFSEKADIPTRPKVTNHSNSQEKFEINEKKYWVRNNVSAYVERTVRQIVMRYYVNKLLKKWIEKLKKRAQVLRNETEAMRKWSEAEREGITLMRSDYGIH